MEDMNKNEHVVIMGAGPAGLATGHELSVSGVKVSVIDRNDFGVGVGNWAETAVIGSEVTITILVEANQR